MIRIAKGDRAYCEAFIQSLKARVSENDRSVEDKVAEILKDVRDNGDEAVRRYTMKFDGWAPEKAEITKEEIGALDDGQWHSEYVAKATFDFKGNLYFADTNNRPTRLYVYRPETGERRLVNDFSKIRNWG